MNQNFVEYVKSHIKEYLPMEYQNAVISVNEVTKSNDRMLTGLTILLPGERAAPTIYLEALAEQVERGMPLDTAMKQIAQIQLENYNRVPLDISMLENYEAVRPMLAVQMCDPETNQEYLKGKPYTSCGELAAYYRIQVAADEEGKLEKTEQEKQHFIAEIKEGLQVFREDKKLFYIVIAEALCMFFYAPLSSFYPLMTSDYFKLSAMYGSAVELSFAIGMMVSSLLFSSVLKINRKILISFTGLFGMGMMSLLCGIIPPTYIGWFFFAGGCICLGASGNVHTIPLTAYMQETVSPEKMGRAFSVLTLISSVTMPIGLVRFLSSLMK